MLARLGAILVAAAALSGGVLLARQQPDAQVPVRDAREVRRVRAAEARQGVAADSGFLYAIDNRRIGKYDKRTGARVGGWEDVPGGRFHHLDSGVVVEGRLYAAHSNYPDLPMVSSIEIWDAATLRHVGSHSFGIHAGSATWVDRHDDAWWVLFANYETEGGEPGRGVEWTVLERFDDDWRRTGGWTLPAALVARLRPFSNSGGVWAADDRLYLTGHDDRELYVVRLPSAGAELDWVETIRGTTPGQGIALDPALPNTLYGIDRASAEIVVLALPEGRGGGDSTQEPGS
jgi:hypothetical protein